jgi:hypothetical protein
MDRYLASMNDPKKDRDNDIFEKLLNDTIIDFNHWAIIHNEYPYDAIASVHHMILPKRKVPFDWNLLNQNELDEFDELRKGYLSEHYEVIWENLPAGQSIPGRMHLHLLTMRREDI